MQHPPVRAHPGQDDLCVLLRFVFNESTPACTCFGECFAGAEPCPGCGGDAGCKHGAAKARVKAIDRARNSEKARGGGGGGGNAANIEYNAAVGLAASTSRLSVSLHPRPVCRSVCIHVPSVGLAASTSRLSVCLPLFVSQLDSPATVGFDWRWTATGMCSYKHCHTAATPLPLPAILV